MVDRLVEEPRHVVVVQAVDDRAAGALGGDEAEGAQEAELVGDRRLLHLDRLGKLGHGRGGLAQPAKDEQSAGRRERLQGGGDTLRRTRIDPCGRRDVHDFAGTCDLVAHVRIIGPVFA